MGPLLIFGGGDERGLLDPEVAVAEQFPDPVAPARDFLPGVLRAHPAPIQEGGHGSELLQDYVHPGDPGVAAHRGGRVPLHAHHVGAATLLHPEGLQKGHPVFEGEEEGVVLQSLPVVLLARLEGVVPLDRVQAPGHRPGRNAGGLHPHRLHPLPAVGLVPDEGQPAGEEQHCETEEKPVLIP